MEVKTLALGGAVAVAVIASSSSSDGDAQSGNNPAGEGSSSAETTPVSEAGEVVVDNETGTVFDDAESGTQNDEPGDDVNTSFETINNNETSVDDSDPTSYAPDDGGSTTGDAPEGGVIADPGESQEWGREGEQENDDLSERAADSELSGSEKDAFDRYANRDELGSDNDGSSSSSGSSNSGGSSGGSTGSGGASSGASTSPTIQDPADNLNDEVWSNISV
jgi:hypothetical protein